MVQKTWLKSHCVITSQSNTFWTLAARQHSLRPLTQAWNSSLFLTLQITLEMFYSWANCDNSEVELNEQVCPSSIIIHNHTGFPPFLSRTSLSFLDTHSWHPKPKRQKSLCIMLNFCNKLQYKFVPLLQLFFRRLQIGKQVQAISTKKEKI